METGALYTGCDDLPTKQIPLEPTYIVSPSVTGMVESKAAARAGGLRVALGAQEREFRR